MAQAIYNIARKTKGALTRERIAESFIDLMLQKRWYQITVKEICAAASITRSTYYQHFDDIHDLMERIQTMLLDDLRERFRSAQLQDYQSRRVYQFQPDFRERVQRIPQVFRAWFEFCEEHKTAMQALTNEENGDAYFLKRLKKVLVEYLDATMEEDNLPQDKLREYFHDLYFNLCIDAMNLWLSDNNDGVTTDQMAMVLNTVRAGALHSQFEQRRTARGKDFRSAETPVNVG